MIALLFFVSGVLIAIGGALEFRYFGPGTPQFLAGLVATPAGLAGAVGGILLWRSGRAARKVVIGCALALLGGTVVATGLDVMGPPATLLGLLGGFPPLIVVWRAQ